MHETPRFATVNIVHASKSRCPKAMGKDCALLTLSIIAGKHPKTLITHGLLTDLNALLACRPMENRPQAASSNFRRLRLEAPPSASRAGQDRPNVGPRNGRDGEAMPW